MIEPRLTDINKNEILFYLGYRGQEISFQTERQIEGCVERVKKYIQPRLVYRRLPVYEGEICGMKLEGKDICQVLQPCHEAILLAVTLGVRLERLLMRSEVTDMSEAVIMDACASVVVENICDCFEEDLRDQISQKEGLFLTSRFSPGYGDLPLDSQTKLCTVLDTARRIGLTVTKDHIMIPRKSVTAVLGISGEPQRLRMRGCEVCRMFQSCNYRKNGRYCK